MYTKYDHLQNERQKTKLLKGFEECNKTLKEKIIGSLNNLFIYNLIF